MRQLINIFVSAFVAIVLLSSCDMRELCYDHNEHAYRYQVNIKAEYEQEWQYPSKPSKDWAEIWPDTFSLSYSELKPYLPSGLRVLLYDSIRYDKQNVDRSGGIVYLTEPEKSILLYNNDTETILFNDEEDKQLAVATTRSVTRGLYQGNTYSTMNDINGKQEPDVLYVTYVPSYFPISAVKAPVLNVLLKPVVYTYYIRYEFEYGAQHVALARGTLAGMAGSVNLHTQIAGDDLVTVMFDAKSRSFGVDSYVRSFGLPQDLSKVENQLIGEYTCALNLQVTMFNGKYKTFEFDVTDQVVSQPKGGVIVVKGLRIEDEEAEGDLDGGLVEVDDWGPYEDIIIDF
jgi:hypothetical protein